MPSGTSLKLLEQALPGQYYDVGIAESTRSSSRPGWQPWVSARGRDLQHVLQRAYDCIHHDVCLQDLPVIFCMDRSSLGANDGPTIMDCSTLPIFDTCLGSSVWRPPMRMSFGT